MISIIIPVYNTPIRFLEICVRSALEQTVAEKEIIIVNDGSSEEDTLRFLNGLSSLEGNVLRIIHTPNQGVSGARYTGICEAKGEYIVFLDADDAMNVRLCERLSNLIQSGGYDLARVEGREVLDLEAVDFAEGIAEKKEIKLYGSSELEQALVQNGGRLIGWAAWAKMFRREILLKTYRVHAHIYRGEDVVSLAEYLTVCKSIVYAGDILYYYNKGNEGSSTKSLTWKSLTIADCWVEVYDIQRKAGFMEAADRTAIFAMEALIGAVVHAKRRGAVDRIPDYSAKLGRFKRYWKKLSGKNRVKLFIISYFPWFYRFWK